MMNLVKYPALKYWFDYCESVSAGSLDENRTEKIGVDALENFSHFSIFPKHHILVSVTPTKPRDIYIVA